MVCKVPVRQKSEFQSKERRDKVSNFDLVVKNGTIITVDATLSKKRWFAVKDGLIAATGDRDDFAGEAKEILYLR